MKRLRGARFDPFGYSADRQRERQLIRDYEQTVALVLEPLRADNHAYAVELAGLPEQMRGYGHVQEAAVAKAKAREAELLHLFRNPPQVAVA